MRGPANLAREALAERIREALPPFLGPRETAMFGSIAFLVDGNILVCAMKDGAMLVRCGAEAYQEALLEPGARRFGTDTRTMTGFVLVAADAIEDEAALAGWIERAWRFVRTLEPR